MRTTSPHYRIESKPSKTKGKRWRAVVRLPGGRREFTSWRDHKYQATEDGDDLLDVLTGPKPSKTTVSQVVTRYMAARRLRPTTRQRYQHDADAIAEDDIGSRLADAVLPAEWDEYFAGLALSPKSVGNRRGLVHAAYRWAKRGGLLRTNPIEDTDPPKVRRDKPPAPTLERVQGAVEVLTGNRLEGAAVLVAANGLRVGEAVARRWRDFSHWVEVEDDVEQLLGTVDVHDQYTQTRGMGRPKGERLLLHLGPPKSDKGVRILPVPAPAVRHLLDLKRRQQMAAALAGAEWSDDALISSRRDGSPIPPNQASSELGRLWRRAGYAELHPHLLRHAFITELIVRQGVDAQTAADLAGHSTAATTVGHYTHTEDAAKTAAIRRLSQAQETAYEKLVDSRRHQSGTKAGSVADISKARKRKNACKTAQSRGVHRKDGRGL